MMVTYNRLNLTQQTLTSLFETTTFPFELVIVDNGSTDGTVDFLKKYLLEQKNTQYFQNYQIKKNPENLGIAVGRNQALSLATSPWLCTIDNDVLLPSGWLGQCVDILTHNKNYGMIGVNFEPVSFPLVSDGIRTWQKKPQGNLGTACMVFNRSLHQLLGYFNTEYGLYGEEDADWGIRGRLVGLQLGYLKEAGKHLGEGVEDQGEYREFKTKKHKDNLNKFHQNCYLYANKKKPIYLNWTGDGKNTNNS